MNVNVPQAEAYWRAKLLDEMDFDSWVAIGVNHKWTSKPFCYTHDGLPMTEQEFSDWEEGIDPCTWGLRFKQIDEELEGGREGWPS